MSKLYSEMTVAEKRAVDIAYRQDAVRQLELARADIEQSRNTARDEFAAELAQARQRGAAQSAIDQISARKAEMEQFFAEELRGVAADLQVAAQKLADLQGTEQQPADPKSSAPQS